MVGSWKGSALWDGVSLHLPNHFYSSVRTRPQMCASLDYFYSWQYMRQLDYTATRSNASSFLLIGSFPRFLTLFPSLSLSSHLYLNTNGGLLKRKCWSPCCISHSGSMSHQPHTCWKCVLRIIGACASFPRLQVIIGLSGLHVAWCSISSERCLWQKRIVRLDWGRVLNCELMTRTFDLRDILDRFIINWEGTLIICIIWAWSVFAFLLGLPTC